LKAPDWADFALAGAIIIVSFAPLFQVSGWQSLSGGGYDCVCGKYFLTYSGPAYGGDRPHVFISYEGYQIDVIQVSDSQSGAASLGLSNFTESPGIHGSTMVVNYTSPGFNFTKIVAPRGDSIAVTYSFGRVVTANITLWRWYFGSIGPFDRPATRNLGVPGVINYSFIDQGAAFNVTVTSSPAPTGAQISGVPGEGLNKINLEFKANTITLLVRIDSIRPLVGAGAALIGPTTAAYPIIGICLAGAYLAGRRWVVGRPH
jgi:hypothetical protein